MACCFSAPEGGRLLPASPWLKVGAAPPLEPSCPVCIHPTRKGTSPRCTATPMPNTAICTTGGGIITGRGEGELLVAGQICFIPAGWEHEFRVLRRSRLSLLYVPTSARTAFGPLQASPLLAGLFARLPELAEEEVKGPI